MNEARLAGRRIGLVGPLPPPSGGMANQTRQLSRLLSEAGAKVTVVQTNKAYQPDWIGQVPFVRAAFRLFPYFVQLWRTAGHSDIFHVMANSGWSWHLLATPAIWVAHCRGIAVVVNYRGGEAEHFLRRAGPIVRFTMQRASALIVPSGFLNDVFRRFQMVSEIVPNIVDLEKFSYCGERQVGSPHLLVARNLEVLYDNATAIKAFAILREKFPDSMLSIAGSGPEESSLRRLVAQLGLEACVNFSGRLEPVAMAALYHSADLMLNPSLADNMPNSLLEAWASGVPVVSTDVGGIPFMATDGVNVSLVKPSRPHEMAQACTKLLSDRALWRRRSEAGLIEAQRYTWENVQPKLADVYRGALEPKQ